MGKHLTSLEKGQILAYRSLKQPMSFRKIANKIKKPKSTIEEAYKRMKNRGHASRKKGSGRPKVISTSQKKRIIISQKRDPFLSGSDLKKEFKLSCTSRTVRNVLIREGLKSHFSRLKPFISEANRRKRLK